MMEQWYETEAKKELLKPLWESIEKELAAAGCPSYRLEEIAVCVEEIFVNIASYAYPRNKFPKNLFQKGMVAISVQIEAGRIRILFQDSGIPYNPTQTKAPDITSPAEERDIGGLGIYMVKNMTDRLEYRFQNNQNCLLMEWSWQA